MEPGTLTLDFNDPLILGGIIALVFLAGLFVMVWIAIRTAGRTAKMAAPLSFQLGQLSDNLRALNDNHNQLAGGLKHVSETQSLTQAQMMQTMEQRLEEVQKSMGESLHGTATRTARSLGELQQRLSTIDKAQSNIEKLSGNVLSLQDILSNKQTRGAFGEIQLNDIVTKALPPDAYSFQTTLSNGRRADCLIHLPNPPGHIVVDSKFPLEAYEAIRGAKSEAHVKEANRLMRAAVRAHIKAISEKYIIEGETADGALMFLPSEAVYAELHANFGDVVREGFAARVWIVSPTTCMATLNTMRAVLKDARMREQAGAIRKELGLLYKDVDRLGARVENLDRHFSQAAKDIDEIKISASKATGRARRLDDFDFDAVEQEKVPDIVGLK